MYNPKQPCFRPLIAYSVKARKEIYVCFLICHNFTHIIRPILGTQPVESNDKKGF